MSKYGIQQDPCCLYCTSRKPCRKIAKVIVKNDLSFPKDTMNALCEAMKLKAGPCTSCPLYLQCLVLPDSCLNNHIVMTVDSTNADYWQQGWHAFASNLNPVAREELESHWETALNDYEFGEVDVVTPKISFVEGYRCAESVWNAREDKHA